MKRPICVKCETEFQQIKTGIAVVDMFPKPYQIWLADLFECPMCKVQIVSGFADKPLAHHFEVDLKHWLQLWKAGGDSPVYNYECTKEQITMNEKEIHQWGSQEPPNDPMIYNRRQADGTFRSLAGFWDGYKVCGVCGRDNQHEDEANWPSDDACPNCQAEEDFQARLRTHSAPLVG